MKPERNARRLLGITRAKEKMWEYSIPEKYHHIDIDDDPAKLFDLSIGALGDLAANINGEDFFKDDQISELRSTLKFAAQFFDSYRNSRLGTSIDPFTTICASCCFYLCDMPGSSLVLAKQLGDNWLELECMYLEDLLLWLLQNDLTSYFDEIGGLFGKYVEKISKQLLKFFKSGNGKDRLFKYIENFREFAYERGSSRQLFFADVISAVVKIKIESSTWHCLPLHSEISVDEWRPYFKKETFIRELWPAQRILGEHGLFNGKSAVVQMPTSAGKTKATELIIRSAFLSNRVSLAIVVAPYKALCHEISGSLSISFDDENVEINELSDVTQKDFSFDFSKLEQKKQVIVVTPEKLHYALRHEPDLAHTIGLAIFDEAHLFDDVNRGVNYELLLSSIKVEIPEDSQTVLLSAVIKNSEQVADWLFEDKSAVVSGMDLPPTNRSIAFSSWTKKLGQLQFPLIKNIQDYAFFVPRLLETHTLGDGKTTFPKRNKPNEIALYLGLTLLEKGSIAVFCGRKDSASLICRKVVEIYKKGFHFSPPASFSDSQEIKNLSHLIAKNLGSSSNLKKSADIGVYAHHGNIPHGIRLAVEYALQQELVKYVVCTSTLAQGVNLPIRYLIVTSVYQGRDRIKTRDFHNLIGRVGRAGMHTEGSILFADPRIYDQRISRENKWRWLQSQELLNPNNAEACVSAIANIFSPIYNDRRDRYIKSKPLDLARTYLEDPSKFLNIADRIAKKFEAYSYDKIMQQLLDKISAIRAIQSYLLAHAEEWENDPDEIDNLVEETLAYSLADEQDRENLKSLFHMIKEDIEKKVEDSNTRKVYGRTLLGLNECKQIEDWVIENIDQLDVAPDDNTLFQFIWPLLRDHISNRSFKRCHPSDMLEEVTKEWLNGTSYNRIFHDYLKDAMLGTGPRPRRFKIEHTVDLCENGYGYDGSLIIGALAEITNQYGKEEGDYSELVDRLLLLQRRIKYGLPTISDIIIYEIGFSDRVVAQMIKKAIKTRSKFKHKILSKFREKHTQLKKELLIYPAYYKKVSEDILA
jgi:POLQ-like helicase